MADGNGTQDSEPVLSNIEGFGIGENGHGGSDPGRLNASAESQTPNSESRVPKMRCDLCPMSEPRQCPRYEAGADCAYERTEAFSELDRPEDVPLIMRDLLAADMMSFFRAKRFEGMSWKGIDNDAVKLGQALHKGLETYLELRRRAAGENADARGLEEDATLDVAAAIASSDGELFSEVEDSKKRDRLVREYLQLLRREREVLEAVGGMVRDEGLD